MEGKTHFENIVGGTQEEKNEILYELQKTFETRSEKLTKYELEKTIEDIGLIKNTELVVDKIVSQYGGKPKSISLDHIYILKPGSVLEMTEGKLARGLHQPVGLNIGVEKKESKLLFASTIAHELFHLKSYKSARKGESVDDIRLYRTGLSMIDIKDESKKAGEEKEYFSQLEEAVVVECTRKFLDNISMDKEFRPETEAIKKIKNWVTEFYKRRGISQDKIEEFNDEIKYISDPEKWVSDVENAYTEENRKQAYAAGMFESLYKNGSAESMERYTERKKLYDLLDKLVLESNRKYKNRNELFDEFAKANFSGNYLPLAKIIESILGKGSFRKIAEDFSNKS